MKFPLRTVLLLAVVTGLRVAQGLELVSAHTFGRTNQVVLRFSEPVAAAGAADIRNFSLEAGAEVTKATRLSPWFEMVVLDFQPGPAGSPGWVQASGLTSTNGGALEVPARATMEARPALPDDVGSEVTGFQDEFATLTRDPRWVPRGGSTNPLAIGPDRFAPQAGHLLVQGGASALTAVPPHLLFEQAGYDLENQEVLVRILTRANSRHADEWSGPSAAVGFRAGWPGVLDDYRGLSLAFLAVRVGVLPSSLRLEIPGRDGTGPSLGVTVQTQTWYWARLRRAAPAAAGQPDTFGRLWPADGTVPEPRTWVAWVFDPRVPVGVRPAGYAGIASPVNLSPGGGFLVDYFLLKAAGLPTIAVAPGALRPPQILAAPPDRAVLPGAAATLDFVVNSDGPATYEWYRDQSPLGTGTSPVLALPAFSEADVGTYLMIARNVFGATTSAPVVLTLAAAPLFADPISAPAARPEWSVRTVTTDAGRGTEYLGGFTDEGVRLVLTNLPTGGQALLTADLLIFGGWRGANLDRGPDGWRVGVPGKPPLLQTTFASQVPAVMRQAAPVQHFPNEVTGAPELALTGAREVWGGTGLTRDAVYSLRLLVPLEEPDLELEFRDEHPAPWMGGSWGLDNVVLTRLPTDTPLYRLRQPILHPAESEGNVLLGVERLGNIQSGASVRFSTVADTAVAGRDYTPVDEIVSFAPGETVRSVAVPLLDNAVPNPPRTFIGRLSDPGADGVLADRVETGVVIHDDETRVELVTATPRASEGEGALEVSVRLVGEGSSPVFAAVIAEPGTAEAGEDFVLRTNYVGLSIHGPQTVPVPVIDDALEEPDEGLSVRLLAVLGNGVIQPAAAVAAATIEDNDLPSQAGFAVDGRVDAVLPLPDGAFYIHGSFTRVNGVARPGLARLLPSGEVDPAFVPSLGEATGVPVLQPDGALVLSGVFSGRTGDGWQVLARLRPDGSRDLEFVVTADQAASVAGLANGRLVVSGGFTRLNGFPRAGLAVLNPEGTVDPAFDPRPGPDRASIERFAALPDGRFYGSGYFTAYGGTPRPGLALINADGTLDEQFNPAGESSAYAPVLLVQGPDRLLVGAHAPGAGSLRRLLPDGKDDPEWGSPLTSGWPVRALALQPDGRLLAAGSFSMDPGIGIVRLLPDGAPDPAFVFGTGGGFSGTPLAVGVQPDGHILVGGQFKRVNGVQRMNLVRLNADGSDAGWPGDPGAAASPTLRTNAVWLAGAEGVLTVEHAPTEGWTYTWSFNGQPIPGESGPQLRVAEVTSAAAGSYEVRGRGPTTDWLSRPVDLRVLPAAARPRITAGAVTVPGVWSLRLNTVAGLRYRLEGSEDLRAWRTVTGTLATAEEWEIQLPVGEGAWFLRAVVE